MLDAHRLMKRFAGVAAVNDVSFAVRGSEIVGYLGPNGSGKSTTAKILAALLPRSAGHVRFDGRLIDHDPIEFRRRLGYVPEEPQLYPFLSGREYLELIGRLRELPEPHLTRKIDRMLELFGLHSAADQDAMACALIRALAPRDQVTRAGFFFALQVIARSVPHRIALATSAGIAIALTTVILGRTDVRQASLDATFELLTIQPLFLAGFWHATRVPAAARHYAPLLLSWPARDRRFRHCAMRAGLVAVAMPCLLVLCPLYVAALGWPVAVAHAAFGGVLGATILEALFFRTSRAPFVSSYVPSATCSGFCRSTPPPFSS